MNDQSSKASLQSAAPSSSWTNPATYSLAIADEMFSLRLSYPWVRVAGVPIPNLTTIRRSLERRGADNSLLHVRLKRPLRS